ncbi:MAG: bifunctional methylenetetrahydrofolate dehydrogenase/methenyltetrahydrofolate cyclohydrolase FolD [Clostridia bacterium]|nr:bifunctional methylenetetrahydrofolate dehydrogenase/methenyltetrahydrofolate cyclohydrolase FolD [Clostridia bacterium]
MEIIDGKLVSCEMRKELAGKIEELKENFGKTPKLSVVIVGNDPASEIYVRNKSKACEEVGIISETIKLDENTTQEELDSVICGLSSDKSVDGILIQLPLPRHIDAKRALSIIPTEKDVDGFSSDNIGKLTQFDDDALLACTPHGIIELLKRYGVDFCGKHAVVVGRSNIVGKPVALLLLKENCTVTICHSKTQNLSEITKQADILVCAVGQKHLIKEDMVKEGVIAVDAGINRVDGKIYGDMDFDGVSKKAALITPVPGGVGPMTITMLLYNTYFAALRKTNE